MLYSNNRIFNFSIKPIISLSKQEYGIVSVFKAILTNDDKLKTDDTGKYLILMSEETSYIDALSRSVEYYLINSGDDRLKKFIKEFNIGDEIPDYIFDYYHKNNAISGLFIKPEIEKYEGIIISEFNIFTNISLLSFALADYLKFNISRELLTDNDKELLIKIAMVSDLICKKIISKAKNYLTEILVTDLYKV